MKRLSDDTSCHASSDGQQFAQSRKGCNSLYAAERESVIVKTVGSRSSKRVPANLLHRYPSPDRPAYSPSRPITVFAKRLTALIRGNALISGPAIGYQGQNSVHTAARRCEGGATPQTYKGNEQCKRKHLSFSQPWPSSVSPAAWKVTPSVVSQAQVLASWLQKCLGQIVPAPCSPVLPLASCVTTPVSTAAVKSSQASFAGARSFQNRRRGMTPAAVFRL